MLVSARLKRQFFVRFHSRWYHCSAGMHEFVFHGNLLGLVEGNFDGICLSEGFFEGIWLLLSRHSLQMGCMTIILLT